MVIELIFKVNKVNLFINIGNIIKEGFFLLKRQKRKYSDTIQLVVLELMPAEVTKF